MACRGPCPFEFRGAFQVSRRRGFDPRPAVDPVGRMGPAIHAFPVQRILGPERSKRCSYSTRLSGAVRAHREWNRIVATPVTARDSRSPSSWVWTTASPSRAGVTSRSVTATEISLGPAGLAGSDAVAVSRPDATRLSVGWEPIPRAFMVAVYVSIDAQCYG